MSYVDLENEKNNIIHEIKVKRITTMERLERIINIPISTIISWGRNDPSFKNIVEEIMYQNKLKVKSRSKERIEKIFKTRDNERFYGHER